MMDRLNRARGDLGEVYTATGSEDVEVALFNAKIEIDAARLVLHAGMSYPEAKEMSASVVQTGEASSG